MSLLLAFGCTSPKVKPQAPNINWTAMDEPPLYPDCPKENINQNLNCFTDIFQGKLQNKLRSNRISSLDLIDTLFVRLKVDTIGQITVFDYLNKNKIPPLVFSSVEEVVASLPKFQPAFKTNLEVPVEVYWELPVTINNSN
ncbi:MAG: Uncharacterised protein [Bacteroidota bacterium]|nr:MAG: Uncharacterised protein [Bacteroidota bacterium]